MMVTVLITLAVFYAVLRRIPIMPLVTAVILTIFGSLTLLYHDETLIKTSLPCSISCSRARCFSARPSTSRC